VTPAREVLAWRAASLVVLAVLCWHFGEVPAGLYLDEASVGVNAHALNHSIGLEIHGGSPTYLFTPEQRSVSEWPDGLDQHGAHWPLFFEAFGDWKSPLYVYAAFLTESALCTPFTTRLPSLLYALGAAWLLCLILRELTGDQVVARWLALGYLLCPCTFTYARTAVSEASCVPFYLLLAILAVLRWERAPSARSAAVAGLALGLTAYSYSTWRLLGPLAVVWTAWCYRRRPGVGWFLGAAALMGIPMGIFMLNHPGALELRLETMSIWRDHPGAWVVAWRFVQHYAQHLGPDFLFLHGDPNLRHNPGGGFLQAWIIAPAVLGVLALWWARRPWLLGLVAISPVAVALTHFDTMPHASRMLHLAPLIFLLAGLGLMRIGFKYRRAFAAGALFQACLFVAYYFGPYAAKVQGEFDGGVVGAFRIALENRRWPEPIYIPPGFVAATNGIWLQYASAWTFDDRIGELRSIEQPMPPGSLAIVCGDREIPSNWILGRSGSCTVARVQGQGAQNQGEQQ
jgi:hypothetical protein